MEDDMNDNEERPPDGNLDWVFRSGYLAGLTRACVTLDDTAYEKEIRNRTAGSGEPIARHVEAQNIRRSARTIGGLMNKLDDLLVYDRQSSIFPKDALDRFDRLGAMSFEERVEDCVREGTKRQLRAGRPMGWQSSDARPVAT